MSEGIKGSAGPNKSGACDMGIAALNSTKGTIEIKNMIIYFIPEFITYFFFLEFFEFFVSVSTAAGAGSAACFFDFIIPQSMEAMQREE